MMEVFLIDVVPQSHSNETWQDAEPSVAVNPAHPGHIVVSAFTPPDPGQTDGPLYCSVDHGHTWNLSFIVPGGEPNDQTYKFATHNNEFYGGDLVDGSFTLNELRTPNPVAPGAMSVINAASPDDQPFIEAATVHSGPAAGSDRTYVGLNDLGVSGTTGQTAAIDVCLDAKAPIPVVNRVYIEKRSTGSASQNGPQVRTAIHHDGTIYAVFAGWRSFNFGTFAFTTDVVVVRDDNWGSGLTPFTALVDPGDGIAGMRVQTGVSLVFNAKIGQERTAGSFAIAVHPHDSNVVYICWAGPENGVYTLHVQRSHDRGVTWSKVLLEIPNATNPALAIAKNGRIGFLYQQVTGTAPNDRWEAHFRHSMDGKKWRDVVLANTPASTPVLNIFQGLTYIGDYIDMVAVDDHFYGTFCANNTPDPANFPATPPTGARPNGAVFLRNVTHVAPWGLLGTNGVTPVAISIDPFFFRISWREEEEEEEEERFGRERLYIKGLKYERLDIEELKLDLDKEFGDDDRGERRERLKGLGRTLREIADRIEDLARRHVTKHHHHDDDDDDD
jgi:hypothetical protein